jgi:hypothetical protein
VVPPHGHRRFREAAPGAFGRHRIAPKENDNTYKTNDKENSI